MNRRPIKRDEALKPLSHDHYHALLLYWKIRTGFTKGVEFRRIKEYVNWFYNCHIKAYFEIEERLIYPILGSDTILVKKALSEYCRLEELFGDTKKYRRVVNST